MLINKFFMVSRVKALRAEVLDTLAKKSALNASFIGFN